MRLQKEPQTAQRSRVLSATLRSACSDNPGGPGLLPSLVPVRVVLWNPPPEPSYLNM